MKRAIIKVSNELLRELLRLPDGVTIQRIMDDPDCPGQAEFLLEGDVLPDSCVVSHGKLYKLLTPSIKAVISQVAVFNGWGE